MKIFQHTVFPTRITYAEGFLTDSQTNEIFEYLLHRCTVPTTVHGALKGNATSSHPFNQKKYCIVTELAERLPTCSSLKIQLEEIAHIWSVESGYRIGGLDNSWFNIQNEGSTLVKHNHPAVAMAGVLYIGINQNSSPIYFDSPNPYQEVIEVIPGNSRAYKECYFHPNPGDLILFPAWLYHHSGPNPNISDNRVVVSFNFSHHGY